jgi:DNA replication and repair protein RecF
MSEGADAPSFRLQTLRFESFRNLGDGSFEPSPRFNVVFGANGHGKTSLLEALYVVATTKSFRTAKLRTAVRHGSPRFALRARFVETTRGFAPLSRDHSVVFEDRSLHVRLDENRPRTLADYAVKSPVVVFHPEELTLSTGPAALRRRLLDRVALYRSTSAVVSASRYEKALRARQELLRKGGGMGEIEAYETLMVEAGTVVTRARAEAADALCSPALEAFRRIAAPDLVLELVYRPGGTADPDEARRELQERRDKDRRSVTATFGPHRDDLELRLGRKLAREVASQGQHRAITLSLKAAESAAVTAATGLEPLQLLDDVSSELDPERTDALHRGNKSRAIFSS